MCVTHLLQEIVHSRSIKNREYRQGLFSLFMKRFYKVQVLIRQ